MTTERNALEERLLFLEHDLEALSRVVATQGLALERLEAEVRELRRTATSGNTEGSPDAGPPRTLEDDRPPHY